MRGYFGIGIIYAKHIDNLGTLFRSAHAFGVDFLVAVGDKYRRESTDTTHAKLHKPLFHYDSWQDLMRHYPQDCSLVAVDNNTKLRTPTPLHRFVHPERSLYLLGNEATGLPPQIIGAADYYTAIDTNYCLNVAVAGSIILYDRTAKGFIK